MPILTETPTERIVKEGLWRNNPIFRQVLGICSSLAVTNLMMNTAVMCIALIWSIALSSFTVSLLRDYTPRRIRMMVQTLIIAFYVILVDLALRAYWPDMSRSLGPYVGLIITNCIIMGRAEAYAISNKPWPSLLDGAFNGLGYAFVLMAVAFFRELLGMGSLFGVAMPYFSTTWDKWIIFVMPPGAFFMLGVVTWILRTVGEKQAQKQAAAAAVAPPAK